mgnify:CR=1 FL=1
MKITKSSLRKIIKEELEQVMFEKYMTEDEALDEAAGDWWDPMASIRGTPSFMKPEYGANEPGPSMTAADWEAKAGKGGSGVPAGPYQDPAPAGSGMDTQQTMASPAQLASIEPTDRYMGMSVNWLKKRGWEWDERLGDFVKAWGGKTKSLRQHMARWSGKRRKWNVKPSGERGGLPTSQD